MGGEVIAELIYDKLQKHCKVCCLLDHEEKDCPAAKGQGPRILGSKTREVVTGGTTRERREDLRRRDYREERSYISEKVTSQDAKSQRSHLREGPRDSRVLERFQKSHDSRDDYQHYGRREESGKSRSHTQSCRNDFPEGLRDRREDQRRRSHNSGSRAGVESLREHHIEASDSHHGADGISNYRSRHLADEGTSKRGQEELPLPPAEVEVAMRELREVMIQYANCPDPAESAARRERVRLAEEQGEFVHTAEQMVRASLPS